MPWLVKLYLLGLLVSLLSALFGLLGFVDQLLPLPGLEPSLPEPWTGSEGSGLVDGPRLGLAGSVKLQPHRAVGSYL